jgi:hypothetical protein
LGDECSVLLLKIAARGERHGVNLRSRPDARDRTRSYSPGVQCPTSSRVSCSPRSASMAMA